MATFRYKGRESATNKIVRGSIDGATEGAAAKALMTQGIVPLDMHMAGSGLSSIFGPRVSSKNLVIFTRQLATMMNAGLPLTQALDTSVQQTSDKTLKSIISTVLNEVNGGAPLSDSIAKYPNVFNNVYIALVKSGETSGTLDKSLLRLADQLEHDADQRSKIINAMIYPAIVLVVIIAVVIFMMVSLVPEVVNMYDSFGKTLPVTTQILMHITNFVTKYWYIVLVGLALIIFFMRRWHQTPKGKKSSDAFKLNIPLFKNLFRKLYMSRFSRTMEILLGAGVSMMEALKISADAVNNEVVKEEVLNAVSKVRNGRPLSEALSNQDYILSFVPQMVRIGETSGNIDSMLGKVADYYDKEVDNAINAISTLIEPILMVLMAFMIGFIVLAVLLPIYQLSDTSGMGGGM